MRVKDYTAFRELSGFKMKNIEMASSGEIKMEGLTVVGKDGKEIFETDEFVVVSFKSDNSLSKTLSNLFPIAFRFKGKKVASIEGVLQSLKYKDKKMQNLILQYSGVNAYHTRICNQDEFWGDNGILYWQGKPIERDSKYYQEFLDELFLSACKNPIYKKSLLASKDKYLLHYIGKEDINKTVLTRFKLEQRLNTLREFIR